MDNTSCHDYDMDPKLDTVHSDQRWQQLMLVQT